MLAIRIEVQRFLFTSAHFNSCQWTDMQFQQVDGIGVEHNNASITSKHSKLYPTMLVTKSDHAGWPRSGGMEAEKDGDHAGCPRPWGLEAKMISKIVSLS